MLQSVALQSRIQLLSSLWIRDSQEGNIQQVKAIYIQREGS